MTREQRLKLIERANELDKLESLIEWFDLTESNTVDPKDAVKFDFETLLKYSDAIVRTLREEHKFRSENFIKAL